MQHTSMRPQGGDQSLIANGHENDEDLVLFQDMHKSEKAAMQKPVAVRTPATVAPKAAGEDIFSSSDLDKHDYDWLVTPPVTSFLSSLEHSPVGNHSSLDGYGSVTVKKPSPAIAKVESPRLNSHSRAKPSAQVVRRSSNVHDLSLAHTTVSTRPVTRKLISAAAHSPTPSRSSTSISQPVARSSTLSKSAARIASAGASTPAGRASSSFNRSVSSIRPSTPIKRPATPACVNNPSSASVKPSSSPVHKTSVLPHRNFSSMRPSSPATRAQMPAIYSVALAGMPQDSPSNLRTSAADRPLSNPRVYPLTKATAVGKGIHSADVRSHNRQSLSSPIVTRGRVSSCSLYGEDKTLLRRNGKPPDAAMGVGNKAVDKSILPTKTLPLSQEKTRVVLNTGAKQAGQSTSLAREPSGFGRNLSRKSLDMALRHMDIEGSTPNGFQSFMSNVQTSSSYSVRSKNIRGLSSGRGNSTSSIFSSPRGTSSNASSEHSMSIVIDPEISGLGHATSNEIGRATPASHADPSMATSSERKVSCWLGSRVYMDEDSADVMQIFEQELASLSGTDSPLVSQPDGNIDFDDFVLEPI